MKKLRGFALIEVSIALLILGIISSISMNQFASIRKIQSEITTQQHIEFILKALGAYYCSRSIYEAELPDSINKNSEGFGHVPFKALGIMEKYAKDGYGRWILYKLNPNFGTDSQDQRQLGISEFSSNMKDDRVAIILKTYNNQINWISEKNFVQIYAGGHKIIKQNKYEDNVLHDFQDSQTYDSGDD